MRSFTKLILVAIFTHAIFCLQAQSSTIADGNWNDAATWSGGAVPSNLSNAVISHAISVNSTTAACHSLIINSSGSLTCNNTDVLTIGSNTNGGDSPLEVNGTLTMNIGCNIYLRGYAKFGATSTWTMNAGYLEIDGNNGNEMTSVPDGTALLDVSAGGTKNIKGGTIQFNDPHAVLGNFLIKGSATIDATVQIGHSVATDTDTPFAFGDGITFSDVSVDYTEATSNMLSFGMSNTVKGVFAMTNGKLVSSTNSTFEGNIICESPAAIEGSLVCNGYPTEISGGGNFLYATIQSSMLASNGSVRVKNNMPVGNLMLYNSLDLDGNKLTVNGTITRDNTSNGMIITTNGGVLRKQILTGETAFIPIGKTAADYSPITISNTSTTTYWTIKVGNITKLAIPNTKKVNVEWDLKPSAPSTQADIVFEWDEANEEVGFNRPAAALYHWNGIAWDRITPATGPTGHSGTTHSITRLAWSTYSPFAVFAQASLPVELVSFTGKAQQGKALLTWATASEKNNEGFDVEKSFDGKNFDKIGFVKGNGNSTVAQNYNFIDFNFTQNAYYRLKQVDFDGASDYSNTIALNTEGGKNKSIFKSYPNPVSDILTVETSVAETSQLEIIDAVGRVVFKQNVESGNYQISTTSFVKGLYIVRLSNKNDVSIQKIIKN
jgi:hypothetical protein